MPRDGSGAYTRAVSDYVTGTTISSSDVNTEMDDFAAEITNSVDKDGQTVYTGSHDWNGNYMITDVDGDSKVGSPTDDQWDIYLSGAIKHKQTVSGYEFSSISNPTFLGNDTDGVLTFSPNTEILGGILKLYGDTHATKAGDIELLSDTDIRGSWDESAATWDFNNIDGTVIGANTAAAGTFSTLNATGGGALTGTWTDLGTVTTIDINGGTIDGTVIGGTTPAAVTATTLNATGGGALTGTWSNLGTVTTVDINGGTVDGAVIGGTTAAAITGTTITGTSTTDATSTTAAAMKTAGGLGVAKKIYPGDNIVMASAKGIDFAAAGGAVFDFFDGDATNLYTPAFTLGSGTATVSTAVDKLLVLEVGDYVWVMGQIQISAVSTPSGNVDISLPFTAADTGDASGATQFTVGYSGLASGLTAAGTLIGSIGEGGTTMRLLEQSATGTSGFNGNKLQNTTSFYFNFFYRKA